MTKTQTKKTGESITRTVDGILEPAYLSSADLVNMLLAERDLATAQLKWENAGLKASVTKTQAQINVDRAAALLESCGSVLEQAKAHHRRLAEDTSARYKLDWKHDSFVPETGEIVHLPHAQEHK